jgi:hypothetical protein
MPNTAVGPGHQGTRCADRSSGQLPVASVAWERAVLNDNKYQKGTELVVGIKEPCLYQGRHSQCNSWLACKHGADVDRLVHDAQTRLEHVY